MLRRGATRLKIKAEDQEELKAGNTSRSPQGRAFSQVADKGKSTPKTDAGGASGL